MSLAVPISQIKIGFKNETRNATFSEEYLLLYVNCPVMEGFHGDLSFELLAELKSKQ